jgi:hypothetical protein
MNQSYYNNDNQPSQNQLTAERNLLDSMVNDLAQTIENNVVWDFDIEGNYTLYYINGENDEVRSFGFAHKSLDDFIRLLFTLREFAKVIPR